MKHKHRPGKEKVLINSQAGRERFEEASKELEAKKQLLAGHPDGNASFIHHRKKEWSTSHRFTEIDWHVASDD